MKSIRSMYNKLADFFIENLVFPEKPVILEAGCGTGQLTIPLARKLRNKVNNFSIIAVDASRGPYKGALNILKENSIKEKLEDYLTITRGDVKEALDIESESVDIIISNELLCDLSKNEIEIAFQNFYEILKPGGQMGHGVLVPVPENAAQQLFIEADSHSLETLTPEYEWFSPSADETAVLLHKTGFKEIIVRYFDTGIKLSYNEAVNKLKEWEINPSFIENHIYELEKNGLEFPMEYVIFCSKD